MDMKLIPLLSAALLSAAPLQAIQQVKDFESAEAIVQDDGYALFVYGADWDKLAKKRCASLAADPNVQKALGNAVVMQIPLYQNPSDAQKEEVKKQCGKLKVPKVDSYPAILFYNKKGVMTARLCGEVMFDPKAPQVAKEITELRKKIKRQAELLEQAEKVPQGPERARCVGEAAVMAWYPGIDPTETRLERPENDVNRVRMNDPNDTTGYLRCLTMKPTQMKEIHGLKGREALPDLEKIANDPAYQTEQRQLACTLMIGILHRFTNTNPEFHAQIKDIARKLRELGPDTILGRSEDVVTVSWGPDMSILSGWKPATLPDNTEPLEVKGSIPVSDPGTYTVTFTYTSGAQGLTVEEVILKDGTRVVATDRHKGFAGRKPDKNVYTLKVTSKVRNPRLFVSFNMGANRDSHGRIEVKRVYED